MKLVSKDFRKDGSGFVRLVRQEAEDLWHVYNLIAVNDWISAMGARKVKTETSLGGNKVGRILLELEVQVEAVEYDNLGAVLPAVLRVTGKNLNQNEYVPLGAYHTLDLDLQRPFVLTKPAWDSIAVDFLKKACDPGTTADVAAVILQEGLATVCLLGESVTTTKARTEASIPAKRGTAVAGCDKALNIFLEKVLEGVLRHVDFSIVKCLTVAKDPGFAMDQLYNHMMLEVSRRDLRQLIESKNKIVLAHRSSGYKHSLNELLVEPIVLAQIKDTRAAKEVKAMQDFYSMLTKDSARAIWKDMRFRHLIAFNLRQKLVQGPFSACLPCDKDVGMDIHQPM